MEWDMRAMEAINVNRLRFDSVLPLMVTSTALFLLCATAAAQSAELQGVINGRSGNTMTVQTSSGNVTVVLNGDTQVEDVQGVFHARKKQMGVTALVPGLSVQVKGSYNAQNQLVADTVKFNGKALQTATDIQAGVAPVQQEEQQQQQQIAQQQAQIQATEAEQAKHEQEIEQEKAAVAAVNKRFGELGEYNIWDKAEVLFANGQVKVDQQYIPKLLALCQKAKTVKGYVIQVQGYASKVGSAAVNQKLSQERAQNVIDIVEQQSGIPLTNVVAPGAMGTSNQAAPDNTAEGQAENRRVVVRVLQNKGIAGA
jgi:outer membrane protein OmpA-like peptidoglycan-associated protein